MPEVLVLSTGTDKMSYKKVSKDNMILIKWNSRLGKSIMTENTLMVVCVWRRSEWGVTGSKYIVSSGMVRTF